jgi:hypothetical protein
LTRRGEENLRFGTAAQKTAMSGFGDSSSFSSEFGFTDLSYAPDVASKTKAIGRKSVSSNQQQAHNDKENDCRKQRKETLKRQSSKVSNKTNRNPPQTAHNAKKTAAKETKSAPNHVDSRTVALDKQELPQQYDQLRRSASRDCPQFEHSAPLASAGGKSLKKKAPASPRKGIKSKLKKCDFEDRRAGHLGDDHTQLPTRKSLNSYKTSAEGSSELIEILKKKILPRRTGSDEKRRAKRASSRGRNDNTHLPVPSRTETNTASKKKPAPRSKSCDVKRRSKRNDGWGIGIDERGLPTTSVGCPPVACMRTVSPNNVDTDSFDEIYAQVLQEEEFTKTTSGISADHRMEIVATGKSMVNDRKMPSCDEDRKPPATSGRRSKSNSRTRRSSESQLIAPLSPEELKEASHSGLGQLQRPKNKNRPRRSRSCGELTVNIERATNFVGRLESISSLVETSQKRHSQSSMIQKPVLNPVLTRDELIELARAMFELQTEFQQEGRPTYVDIGFHFCRGNNFKRIQQNPFLWSKIQSKGFNRSEDGDGIYTFNAPLCLLGDRNDSAYDVWMFVARIQGKRAILSSSSGASRRKWGEDVDALVGAGGNKAEENVVVLRQSSQFFPILQFQAALLLGEASSGHVLSPRDDLFVQIQDAQQELQLLVNKFFNSHSPVDSIGSTVPVDRLHQDQQARKIPALPLTDRSEDVVVNEARRKVAARRSDKTIDISCMVPLKEQHEAVQQKQKRQQKRQQPPTFAESVSAVTNPDSWKLAHEVHDVIEEHSVCSAFADTYFPSFSVQAVVSMEELAVLVDNMLHTQCLFVEQKKPTYVEIGYHYCRLSNLLKMQQRPGFWAGIQSRRFSKSEDGDGIYTFNNPLSTRSRGGGFLDVRQAISNNDDVWLLVARIQGNRLRAPTSPAASSAAAMNRKWKDDVDTLVIGACRSEDVVVLKQSTQFFPLLQFRAAEVHETMLGESSRDDAIRQIQMLHQRLQSLLDLVFNRKSPQLMHSIGLPDQLEELNMPALVEGVLDYQAPESIDIMNSVLSCALQIYERVSNKKACKDDCAICLDSLRRSKKPVARLRACGHDYHETWYA